MILDKIIELQIELLKKSRVPTRVLMNLGNFNALVKELETDRYLDSIHNMHIEIINSKQLVVL